MSSREIAISLPLIAPRDNEVKLTVSAPVRLVVNPAAASAAFALAPDQLPPGPTTNERSMQDGRSHPLGLPVRGRNKTRFPSASAGKKVSGTEAQSSDRTGESHSRGGRLELSSPLPPVLRQLQAELGLARAPGWVFDLVVPRASLDVKVPGDRAPSAVWHHSV